MFNIESTERHLRSLRPTRRGAAGKRSKRQRTTAFEFLEERCCPSTLDLWTGGGGTNLYSNAANWKLGVVPNNGNSYLGSPTTFTVEIPTSSAVTLDINATIDNLTLDATSSSLNIANDTSLTVVESGTGTGTIDNSGTIALESTGSSTSLEASGNVSLTGGGTVTMSGFSQNAIIPATSNSTLTNVDNTIEGGGTIKNLSTLTNTGTIEATAGGTLEIYGTTVNDAGGTISADSTSNLTLYASVVDGGSLSAPSGGAIDGIDRPQLNDVTITQGTTYSVDDYTYLDGDLVNEGTINVGNGNQLLVNASTVNLSGGGTITLGVGSEIAGNSNSYTLTNVDNTIQGQGQITYNLASFQNQATINANVSGATLEINDLTATNTGTIEATGGGELEISASTVTNSGATISADSTSKLVLYDATINGGNLTAASPAVIDAQYVDYLGNVTITSGTTYSVDNSVNYLTGNLINQGTMIVGDASNGSNLIADVSNGTLTISGGGTINLNNAGSDLDGNSNNETLVNQDNLIEGQGQIAYNLASFQNQATIDANVLDGTLEINGLNVTNTGTLEATSGGTLLVNGSTVTNSGRTISTDSASKLVLNDSAINGGNLTAASPAVIDAQYVDYLANVTITSGTTYFVDNSVNYLTGNLINQGTIIVGDASNSSNLIADVSNGTITISGGGTINLNNAGSALDGNSNNETLVNQDNLIEGQGEIAYNLASFQNQAIINANVPGGTLEINSVPTTNTGTLESTGGGTLLVSVSTVTNSGGTISADSTSKLVLDDATINGGNLTAASPAVIDAQYVDYLANVTITSGTTYFVDNANNYLMGNLTNDGTVLVGNSTNYSDLIVVPPTITLSGCGTINLNNPSSSLEGNGSNTLQNQGNTIEGPGSVQNLTVVNVPPNPPTATTEAASNITTTGATLNGSVNPDGGTTTAWFIYGTDPTLTTGTTSTASEATDCGCGGSAVAVTAALSGLQPGTTYYDEVVAENAGGTVDGQIFSFIAVAPPTARTQAASGVTATSATLNGSVNPEGSATTVTFVYGTNPTLTTGTTTTAPQPIGSGTSAVAVNAALTGLQPSTTYYEEVVATSAGGTTDGPILSFTTLAPPTATTQAASGVTATSATLNGSVNPEGSATTVSFVYGTNPTLTTGTTTTAPQAIGSGTSAVTVNAALTGLQPSTTYYEEVVATSAGGTDDGSILSFTTVAPPTATTQAASGVTATAATLNGSVNPEGSATTVTFLYGTNPTLTTGTTTTAPQPIGSGTSAVAVNAALTGLQPGTTYYEEVVATSAGGTTHGTILSFTTVAPPTATTQAASGVTATSATLNGSVNPEGSATTVTFLYGTNPTLTTGTTTTAPQAIGSGTSAVAVNAALTGLQPSTTYYEEVVATSAGGTTDGSILSFTTVAPPTARTQAASGVTATSARLNGSVNPEGSATTVTFVYGTNPTLTTGTTTTAPQVIGSGTSAVAVNAALTGLQPSTTYYEEVVATSAGGTTDGSILSFTTVAPPTARTQAASGVTATSATLNGSVNPEGSATMVAFVYGTNPTLTTGTTTTAAQAIGSGTSAVAVNAALTRLQPGTTYYEEVVATSAGGTTDGTILSFTTARATQAPTITSNPTSQTVNAGQTATFTAAASGFPAPTVQWQVNTGSGFTSLNNSGVYSGVTTDMLTITGVTPGLNGARYQAVFSNSVGTATTTRATLTVDYAPTVTKNPSNTTVTAGQTATFTAAASHGNPTPTTVQWQVSTDGGNTFTPIAGATSTTLSFTASVAQNRDEYQAVFSNAAGLSATTSAATLTVVTINEFPTPTSGGSPVGITAGPDGNLWFTEAFADKIGEINPATHAIQEFSIPTADSGPVGITAGPDGNLWFTEFWASKIGEINPATHAIQEFSTPTANSLPNAIAAGPDGNLWFTEFKKIGEINPATHAIQEFSIPTVFSDPEGITAGPDGNLWFTEPLADKIGEINPATHAIQEFSVPTGSGPWDIAAGPDGNLWFTEAFADKIGEINPATHAIQEFSIPTVPGVPKGITAGPDGNLWFTENYGNKIGEINPATHAIQEFSIPTVNSGPTGITAGPDGNLWFTEVDGNKIGEVQINTTVKTATTTQLAAAPNPSTFGQAVTFTASVLPQSRSGTPTGSVTFPYGATNLDSATLSGWKATLNTNALPVGSDSVSAVYGGDTNFVTSTGTLTQAVNQGATATKLSLSPATSVYGQSVTFTATVSASSPGSGTPTGAVTFYDGSTALGTGTLSSGSATFSTSSLALGGQFDQRGVQRRRQFPHEHIGGVDRDGLPG